MGKRGSEKFVMRRIFTERHKKSAIPYMQRLLNRVETEKRKICKQIDFLQRSCLFLKLGLFCFEVFFMIYCI